MAEIIFVTNMEPHYVGMRDALNTIEDKDISNAVEVIQINDSEQWNGYWQQKLQNITKELDGYYEDAHNPAYTENTRERYAQQYQALVEYHSREGYSIRRNSENKHVVSLKEIAPVSEETSYFDK